MSDYINNDFNRKVVNVVGGTTNVFKYIKESDIVIGMGPIHLEALYVGKFAICIGDTYYTGFVGLNNFMKLSEFNFTGRNIKKEMRVDLLIKDINEIYFDFDNKFRELIDLCNILEDQFSINVSAETYRLL